MKNDTQSRSSQATLHFTGIDHENRPIYGPSRADRDCVMISTEIYAYLMKIMKMLGNTAPQRGANRSPNTASLRYKTGPKGQK